MRGQGKTMQQLIAENEELRGRVAALQENERLLSKYFHQDLIGMAAVTVDSRWIDVNDRLCDILGYPKDELLLRNWKDLSHPDDLERALSHFQRLVSGDIDHYTIAKRYVRKDGSTVYTTIAVQAFYREDGAIDCVIGLMEDITARKQAVEALRQSHDELRAIYDGMGDGLLMADVETQHFVRANASICQMLGYSEDELLSLSVSNIHPEADLPFVVGQFRALAEGRLSVSEEIPVLRKDGAVFYAVVSTSRVTYSGRRCVVGFFRDVTERKRAADAIKASEERFRSYFEQGLVGMAVSTADNRWVQ